jgi:hypothetical protein
VAGDVLSSRPKIYADLIGRGQSGFITVRTPLLPVHDFGSLGLALIVFFDRNKAFLVIGRPQSAPAMRCGRRSAGSSNATNPKRAETSSTTPAMRR